VELTKRGRSGGGGSEFTTDGGAPIVGLGREGNGDAGGVMHGQFNVERERGRESVKGARCMVVRAPF
jgi:hypothetical protein